MSLILALGIAFSTYVFTFKNDYEYTLWKKNVVWQKEKILLFTEWKNIKKGETKDKKSVIIILWIFKRHLLRYNLLLRKYRVQYIPGSGMYTWT